VPFTYDAAAPGTQMASAWGIAALLADNSTQRGAEGHAFPCSWAGAAEAGVKLGLVAECSQQVELEVARRDLRISATFEDIHGTQEGVEELGVGLALLGEAVNQFEQVDGMSN